MNNAQEIYATMHNTAFPDGVSASNPEAAVQFLETQTRLAALLVQAEINATRTVARKLPKQSGLGSYRRFLRQALSPNSGLSEAGKMMASGVFNMSGVQSSEMADGIESYRNYLLHGGIARPNEVIAAELVAIVENNAEAINGYLDGSSIEVCPPDFDDYCTIIIDKEIDLSPLIYWQGGHFLYLREASKRGAKYVSTNQQKPVIELPFGGAAVAQVQIENLVNMSPGELPRQMRFLEERVRLDIKAFVEPGTVPLLEPGENELWVEWTLNAENPTVRRDQFVLSKQGGIRWHDPESKVDCGYDEFIKVLANWSTVVNRVAEDLRSLRNRFDIYSQEDLFESHQFVVPENIETKYSFTQEPRRNGVDRREFMKSIDEAAGRATQESQIFFLKGEAGIGKTHNLIDFCLLRAEECAAGLEKPLYIYVDCAKTSLLDLKDLITARVSFTRNLDYMRVAALCRNGLAAIVIDSFDELLGGVGYRRASELLDPFVKLLSDNGSIVLTARSSYYSNQYKTDLARGGSNMANARHFEVELMRWSRQDVPEILAENGVPSSEMDVLTPDDVDLLTLPFFCRVFASAPPQIRFGDSLRELLVGQYIAREQRKLSAGKGDKGVDRAELDSADLDSIFTQVAGYMHELQESELPESEYRFACAVALNLDLDSNRYGYLRDRLQNLCGLQAGSVEKAVMFGFSHDLYYETFLGKKLILELEDGREGVDAIFEYGEVGDAAMSMFIHRADRNRIRDYLQYATSSNSFDTVGLGNLAAAVSEFVTREDASGLARLYDLNFSELDLRYHDSRQLLIEDCRIERLIVSVTSLEDVRIMNSLVGRLEVEGIETGDLSALYLDESSVPSTLILMSGDHQMGGASVQDFLESLDAVGKLKDLHCRGPYVSLMESVGSGEDEVVGFGIGVLEKFEAKRARRFLVKRDTLAPAESTDTWLQKLGSDSQWRRFVNALVDCRCASATQVDTSGSAKLRVTFSIDPRVLLRERSAGKAADFWSVLAES